MATLPRELLELKAKLSELLKQNPTSHCLRIAWDETDAAEKLSLSKLGNFRGDSNLCGRLPGRKDNPTELEVNKR